MDKKQVKVPTYLTIGKVISYAMYIWVMFGIIVLGLRVFLLTFSANPATPFVNFIYDTSNRFLEPFRGIFPPKSVGATGYLDVASIFAMIIWGFIAWGFSALIDYVEHKIKRFKAEALAEQRREELLVQQKSTTTTVRKPATPRQPVRS